MQEQNVTIRKATKEDTGTILRFIKELAAFEKLEHEVVATENILQKTLFGKRAYAEVIIAEVNENPVGFALYFHNFSTFLGRPGIYIEDLYVCPEFRGKGIGKLILRYLARLAKDLNCGRIEWWVLKWNPARKFYDRIGAETQDDWVVYRLSGAPLHKLGEQHLEAI